MLVKQLLLTDIAVLDLIPVWFLVIYVTAIFALRLLWFVWDLPADDPLKPLIGFNLILTIWLALFTLRVICAVFSLLLVAIVDRFCKNVVWVEGD